MSDNGVGSEVTIKRKLLWLDCDPGRDDLVAILLALHLPQIELVGLSSTHGNNTIDNMTCNAVRCLCSFGSPEQIANIPVHRGVAAPLIRESRLASHAHGEDGLGGVEGLLSKDDPRVREKLEMAMSGNAVLGMAKALRSLPNGEKLTISATGSLTNVALLITMFPELVKKHVESIVIMGGAEGRGNRTPVAESNVFSDPEAAHIVLNFDIPKTLFPLNVTHTALLLRDVHLKMLQPDLDPASLDTQNWPKPATTLRRVLHTNMSHFAEVYRTRDGFEGPPCHDALTIAYLAHPELFEGRRHRLDVELNGTLTAGATVVDIYGYRRHQLDDSWGKTGLNVFVAEKLDVGAFWDIFLDCVRRADTIACINQTDE